MSEKPKNITKALVDGDVIVYKSAFSKRSVTPEDAEGVVDEVMDYIIGQTVVFPHGNNFFCWITGKNNFRHRIAKTRDYKGNRRNSEKPVHYTHVREYLKERWGAQVTEGCEADDAISIEAYKGDLESTVIVSVDKDMLTVPCWNFNFTSGIWTKKTEWESLLFFYEQILTGDRIDNIIGLYGIGEKKAQGILEGATTEEELFQKCLDAYDGNYDRVVENGRLLHLQEWEKEIWEPPLKKE